MTPERDTPEITERGFKYSLDADVPLGPRYGVHLKDGNEHFGINGFALYALASEAPKGNE